MSDISLKLVFAGTPVFAATVLRALARSRHCVQAVLCRPDKPAGRGRSLQAPPVKQVALQLGLPVLQPISLKGPEAQAALAATEFDVMVVAAYGLILPPPVLAGPRLGCVNVHASLLPRWRGAAPIQRAIEAGDPETGITIMQMDAGLDTGPMLMARAIPIGPEEIAGSLHDRLASLGAEMIVDALDRLARGELESTPQPAEGVTYAARLQRSEEWLDWRGSAEELARRIRAFDPDPGCRARILRDAELELKIWSARPGPPSYGAEPGTLVEVSSDALRVACGVGTLDLIELQRPGGRRQGVRQWLQACPVRVGERMGRPPSHSDSAC